MDVKIAGGIDLRILPALNTIELLASSMMAGPSIRSPSVSQLRWSTRNTCG
jgi:hypothetical protein